MAACLTDDADCSIANKCSKESKCRSSIRSRLRRWIPTEFVSDQLIPTGRRTIENATFDSDKSRTALSSLAAQGVYIGTSSWKYAGWLRQLYTEDRYIWRSKFSQDRFERLCLSEYAEIFKTVCVDAAYYKFPDRDFLMKLMGAVPGDFLFGLKVTDEVTIKNFSNLPRFGKRAGKPNKNFLS